jgi:hypothetical protein
MFTVRILRQPTLTDAGKPDHGRRYALVLWGLTLLFALRVLGQAIQRWLPQEFLPPFAAFQGSALPYWFLLSAQLLILAVMARVSRRVQTGVLKISRRSRTILTWVGSLYMTVALGRLALGLVLTEIAPWFHAWIPAVWHVVLASFVLTIARFDARESARQRPEA